MIAIIDYGMGNLRSAEKGFEHAGVPDVVVMNDPAIVSAADGIVLPGVGAFRDAAATLRDSGMAGVLRERTASGVPFLGICLGMQLLADVGFEDGEWQGLGIVHGTCERLPGEVKVPHIGWNTVSYPRECPLFEGLDEGTAFYFVHSYALVPSDPAAIVGACEYGTTFAAAVNAGSVYAVQFHPEKSSERGLRLLANFGHIVERGVPGVIVFPAIDILGGRAVRLAQGDYDRVTVYNEDPVDQARVWLDQGATWIHVVDLDGARDGVPGNIGVVERIARGTGARIEVGGGIRTIQTLRRLVDAGAERCVLGTKLATDPVFVAEVVNTFGERVVAGIDARDGMVAVQGWREGTATRADELVAELKELGICHLVYTDISRDGMRTGIDASVYAHVSEVARFPVVASGGVSTLDDIRALAALPPGVLEGVIIGRALYEGAFALPDALATAAGEGA